MQIPGTSSYIGRVGRASSPHEPLRILHVKGPKGWTESIGADDVDALCRMGILEHFDTRDNLVSGVTAYYRPVS